LETLLNELPGLEEELKHYLEMKPKPQAELRPLLSMKRGVLSETSGKPDFDDSIRGVYWSRLEILFSCFDIDENFRRGASAIRYGTSSDNGRSSYMPIKSLRIFRNTYYRVSFS
jgi:hypothetical protein